jgi:isopentenyldiphosphate isomerase
MPEELVDIVNENDEVIGVATKKEAHEKELHHRLVAVWFYNSRGQIFIQKRSLKKKDLPGSLEWTVSGHVSSGESCEHALLRETEEETGVKAKVEEFTLLGYFIPNLIRDGRRVTHVRKVYALKYEGKKEGLKFDPEEVDSFQVWSIDELLDAMNTKDHRFFDFFWFPFSFETVHRLKEITNSASKKA